MRVIENGPLHSETLLRMAGRMAKLGAWSYRVDNESLLWSDEVYAIHDLPVDASHTVEQALDFYSEGSRPLISEAFYRCVSTGHPFDLNLELKTAKGRRIHVRAQGEAVMDGDRIVRVEGAIQDIQELVLAHAAAKRSADELTAVLENLADAFITFDHDWRFSYINKQGEVLLGKPRAELLGVNVWELYPEAARGIFGQEYQRVVTERVSPAFETRIAQVDRWVEVRAYPTHDGIAAYFRDTTERRRREDQLRMQAALINRTQDAILVSDLELRVGFWNDSAERLSGWPRSEALGQRFTELLQHDADDIQAAIEYTLKRGHWSGELTQVARDGKRIIIDSRWMLLKSEDGTPESILVINSDVTERKKLEQQYLRAQRMESIGTLAGGIAHDLNNVLAPIIMSIDYLRLITNEEAQDTLDLIGNSAKRGAEMVGQVLSFARGVDSARVDVQLKHISLDNQRLITETFTKTIKISVDMEPDLALLKGDPTQLHQVLLNLCVNARDALPDGGSLTIKASNITFDSHYAAMNIEAREGPYLFIEVEDNGVGIPRNIIDKIFDPFFTTKEVGKGTGLGLATSLAIVKSHGGFIRAYSDAGIGTRMRIYIPAHRSGVNPFMDLSETTLPRGVGEMVLVVDDEASIRQITRQTLEAFGYRVMLATDGSEAVSIYAQRMHEIDVVLTDMMMPVMDGVATVMVLRRLNPNVRIIAASGITANGRVARAFDAGIRHFLPKPYTAETLLKALRQILAEN